MSQVTRILTLAVAVLAGAVALVAIAAFVTIRILEQPLHVPQGGTTFAIAPGSSFTAVSNSLAEQGLVDYPQVLRWYASVTGKANAVQAGEYRLDESMTARTMLAAFLAGNVQLYSFTIIEGWNFRELLAALAGNDAIVSTLGPDDVPRLLEAIGTSYQQPEGLFLPETYRFPRGTRDIDVLRQAHDQLRKTLDEEWQARDASLPFSDPYQALILASIVEKETARDDERARIAGVFIRRLEHRMRLQTDPTVIYGIGPGFNGNLTRADLQTDSPYNTYTRSGLPPTPIAMPGRLAIRAVLHPAPGNELYFVATGLGDGSHRFSETKEQHDAAVREFLARQKAKRRAVDSK
jgi:peptidoglycan lytic transglycosylase G